MKFSLRLELNFEHYVTSTLPFSLTTQQAVQTRQDTCKLHAPDGLMLRFTTQDKKTILGDVWYTVSQEREKKTQTALPGADRVSLWDMPQTRQGIWYTTKMKIKSWSGATSMFSPGNFRASNSD